MKLTEKNKDPNDPDQDPTTTSLELEQLIGGAYKRKTRPEDDYTVEGTILFTEVSEKSIKILTGTEQGEVEEVVKFEMP